MDLRAKRNADGLPTWVAVRQPEVERLAVRLGIEKPVKVRRISSVRIRGAHSFRAGVHYIEVSKYNSLEEASKTLIHEMTHASQLETFKCSAREFHKAYDAEEKASGYENNRFEVQARENADSLIHEFNLVR